MSYTALQTEGRFDPLYPLCPTWLLLPVMTSHQARQTGIRSVVSCGGENGATCLLQDGMLFRVFLSTALFPPGLTPPKTLDLTDSRESGFSLLKENTEHC